MGSKVAERGRFLGANLAGMVSQMLRQADLLSRRTRQTEQRRRVGLIDGR